MLSGVVAYFAYSLLGHSMGRLRPYSIGEFALAARARIRSLCSCASGAQGAFW